MTTCFGKSVSLGVLVVALLSAEAAAAQDAPAPEEQPGVEEQDIVVVARRRAERLDLVPSSVDVVTGEQLRDAGVETGKDLSRLVPGVQVLDNGSGMNDEMIIRGEGATRQNNIEPGAGLYRDGIFIAGGNVGGRNFVGIDFFDVGQVEVLRGPQGSYFGRNAIGGVINIISARPTDERTLDLRAHYGSQERYGMEAVANVPLGPVALRFGGFHSAQDGGWYRSSTTGQLLDYNKRWGGRVSATVDPTENWSIYALVEYGKENLPAPQVFEYALAEKDPPFNDPGPTGYSVDRFNKPIDVDPRQTRATLGTLFQSTWTLGGVDLTSITGYRRRHATSFTDADFNAASAVARALTATSDGAETFERFVQDTRLESREGPLKWLVGLEYNKVDSNFRNNLLPVVPTTLPAGCAGGVCTLPVAQATARAVYRDVRSTVDDTSWAAYGALTLNFASAWEASVDLRYSWDEKNFDSLETRRLDNPATPANEQIQLVLFESRKFRVFTPGVSLTYRLPGGGSVYGRVATGYRGGGFNNDPGEPGDGVSSIALQRSFDPEYVTSFELGTKGRFGSRGPRFELAAYYNIKRDTFANYAIWVGCPTAAPRPGCAVNSTRNVGLVDNVGDAIQYGLEAQLSGVIREPLSLPGRFTYNFNVAIADGEYREGFVWANSTTAPAATLAQRPLTGNRLGRLRDATGVVSFGYALPVGGDATLFTNLSLRGEFGGFEDPGNLIPYDDVFLADGTIGVRTGKYTFSLIGKNIFGNSYYNISPLNQTFGVQRNQPSTWLLRVSGSF